ncbi:MAG: phosphoribosylglycinamide formyltransferase [Gammaproteobacteria bacterium]|nr:phosphoribosylglycinamide formyltransferase [Gammaproteobacteria bacterium]MDH3806749.1 phosphoribosylglycinamide formyltransferase [Gammaproteobacteria bacterium]
MSENRCQTAILISGSGTNLQSFIDRAACGDIELDLSVVFSNRPEAFGLVRARSAGIATTCFEHGDFSDREEFDRAVAAKLDEWQPELLVLAGFMRILSPWFVEHYQGRILNIHPALLPAYPGLDTHQRVLDAGEKWHGSTVHFVTEELDGGPRILQGKLSVDSSETADELCARVQAIEHQIYPEAANWFGQGRLEFKDGSAWLDDKRLDEPVVSDFD